MTKKIVYSVFFILSAFFLQNCIQHPTGGSSTSTILLYSQTSITEDAINDGTFSATLTITLTGTSTFNSTLTAGTDYDTINLPAGLTFALTRDSDTQATATISGKATKHSFCSDGEMRIYFASTAFSDGKLPIAFEAPIKIEYIAPTLSFSASKVAENTLNNGTFVGASIVATLSGGGTFKAASGTLTLDTDYTFTDLPSGLTPVVTLDSSSQATITFTGAAASHSPAYDATGKFEFTSSAFINSVCSGDATKSIDFEFYRTVVVYEGNSSTGDFTAGGTARAGADELCQSTFPAGLPAVYTGFKALVSISGTDEIRDMQSNYGIPDEIFESVNSTRIANNWADLLDGSLDNSFDDALSIADYWTGSDSVGAYAGAATACNGFTSENLGDNGVIGTSTGVDSTWIDSTTPATCDTSNPVVCVAYVP